MSFDIQALSGGGSSITSGNTGNAQSHFGRKIVSDIDCSGSVYLDRTIVREAVKAKENITATGAQVRKMNAGGNITATSSECPGQICADGSITITATHAGGLEAGGNIIAVDSPICSQVSAGDSITANRCRQLGAVKAIEGSVDLDECPSVCSVSAKGQITLRQTNVQGDVFTVGNAVIDRAKVGGALTCASNRLVIEDSDIDTVNLRCSCGIIIGPEDISIQGGGISMGNVFIDNGSVMIGNISGNSDNIFINGVALSRLQEQQAPSIEAEKQEAKSTQTLVLRNTKVKNVIFEGRNGEVVLFGDSHVTGHITGGKIKD
jgi:hypothetical protein